MAHSALPQPPMSWLRKMSAITRTSRKIQAIHRNSHTIDQNTPRMG